MGIHLFTSLVSAYKGGILQAKILSAEWSDVYRTWSSDGPWEGERITFDFGVWPKATHPDNYFTGCSLELYSSRLVAFLEERGALMETFPARLLDRKTGSVIMETGAYTVCRIYHRVDVVTPVMKPGSWRAIDFLFNEFENESVPPVFRCTKYPALVIRDDVMNSLQENGMTGCQFRSLNDLALQNRKFEALERP